MFEIGSKVVLIDNDITDKTYYNDLELYDTYIVEKDLRKFSTDNYIKLKNHLYIYNSERFISLLEYRKLKLERLKLCITEMVIK